MEIVVRQSSSDLPRSTHPTHRCPQCRVDALILRRRHVSSPGWGDAVITEYYDCDYCDAKYAYSPADGRWKVVSQ
jgi:hypothetical protein